MKEVPSEKFDTAVELPIETSRESIKPVNPKRNLNIEMNQN